MPITIKNNIPQSIDFVFGNKNAISANWSVVFSRLFSTFDTNCDSLSVSESRNGRFPDSNSSALSPKY